MEDGEQLYQRRAAVHRYNAEHPGAGRTDRQITAPVRQAEQHLPL